MRIYKHLIGISLVVLLAAATFVDAQTNQPAEAEKPQWKSADPGQPAKTDQPAKTADDAQPAETDGQEGQDQTQQKDGPVSGKKPGFFGGYGFYIVLLGGFVLLYFWMGRSRRKQEAKRKEMLSNLKKGDKVTSIGGIVGTVIEVRESEVTVKVDETNNVRMRFARWAIRGVGETAKTEAPEDRR